MTAPKAKARSRSKRNTSVEYKGPLTRIRPAACRKCGRPIYAGHLKGEPVRVDQARITATAELVALLRGLRTYFVNSRGDDLYRRRAPHIESDTPPRYGYIHAEHDCGLTYAAAYYDLRDLWPVYRGEEVPF